MSEAALTARCAAKEAEMNEVERRLVLLREKIDACNRRLPRRPGINGDQLRAEMKAIDTKLTTTSMKLVEEKSLLRKKDSIKTRLKDLAGFESSLQDVQALKDQRGALIAEKRDKAAQVAEMKQGLRRLRLAGRLGVAARELAQESIEVPCEAIGRVIGKKRAALAQLEEDCKVSISEEIVRFESVEASRQPGAAAVDSTNRGGSGSGDILVLRLSGTREGVDEARARLDLTIRTTEAIVEAPPPLAAALRVGKRALLLRLEEELNVKIFVGSTIVSVVCGSAGGGSGGGDDAFAVESGSGSGGGSGKGRGRAGGRRGNAGSGGGASRGERHHSRGRSDGRMGMAPGARGKTAVELTIRGVPENVEAARMCLAKLDCVEVVVPVERKSLSAIFGSGGANLQQMESDYSVSLEVLTSVPKVILMGVREDVEAAAEKIREISLEFRETEERWPVEPYQVKFLLYNRGAELRAITQRVGGGIMISIGKAKIPAISTTAAVNGTPLREGTDEVHGPGDCHEIQPPSPPPLEDGTVAEAQRQSSSHVLVRGTAPRVSAAGALLLERLKVAERLTATVPISEEAVPTFVGHAGTAIRKLRRLCVGCDVELSPVTDGAAEVSLLAEDEAKLSVALGLVEKWVRQQQLRVVTLGSEIAAMLRTFRAAAVRDKITGVDRRHGEAGAETGVGTESHGREDLFGGVIMNSVVAEGVVRLRGENGDLDRAERLLMEFKADNWTMETPVALDDEDTLVRRGLLRDIQAKEPTVHFQLIRERKVVVVRGRQQIAERAAALLQATLHGGGLDDNGTPLLSVSWVPLAPSGVKILTARGRLHLKRLSHETGTDLDVVPSSSVVRIRARRQDAGAIAGARSNLLRFVGSQQVEVLVDLANVDASDFSFGGGGKDRDGEKREVGSKGTTMMVTGADERLEGSGGNVGIGGASGGSGGGVHDAPPAPRKTPGMASNKSLSNKVIRRTAMLHGCEVDFMAVSSPANGGDGSSEVDANGNFDRNSDTSGAAAGINKKRNVSQSNKFKRRDAGGGRGVQVGASANNSHGKRPTTTEGLVAGGVEVSAPVPAPRNVQPRGIKIRGPPGLVEKARNALVALVVGREESEISLGAATGAALEAVVWSNVQELSEDVSIVPDSSRCSLRVCGPPTAVETCRKELYAMLGTTVLRGRFHSVPVPRDALREIASPVGLAAAAAAATAATISTNCGTTAVAETAEILGAVGAASAVAGWVGEAHVKLLADWPCSCIRIRGDVAAARVAVEEIHTAISKWSALEVTAKVENWMVPALYGKQGRAIKKLSQNMGGIVLEVHDGVCHGRATSLEAAREASKMLEERVKELRARRAVIKVPREVVDRLTGRGGCSIDKLKERTHVNIEIQDVGGGEGSTVEVHVSGDSVGVAAAKREVEALARGATKNVPTAAMEQQVEHKSANAAPPPAYTTGTGSSSTSTPQPACPGETQNANPLLPCPQEPSEKQHQRHCPSYGRSAGVQDPTGKADQESPPGCAATSTKDVTAGAEKAAEEAKVDGVSNSQRLPQEDHEQATDQQLQTVETTDDVHPMTAASGLTSNISLSSDHRNACSVESGDPVCLGSFSTRTNPTVASDAAGVPPTNRSIGAKHSPSCRRGAGGGVGAKGVSAATDSEADRLLASLLLVDTVAAPASTITGVPAGRSVCLSRQHEALPVAATTTSSGSVSTNVQCFEGDLQSHDCYQHYNHQQRSRHSPPPPSYNAGYSTGQRRHQSPEGPLCSLPSSQLSDVRRSGDDHENVVEPTAHSSKTVAPSSSLPRALPGAAAGPTRGEGYFTSSSGIRVRL